MSVLTMLADTAAETEERTNITPYLLQFGAKFLAIFAIVAVVTVLTPRIAKWVDRMRERHQKDMPPEDPRCKAVKGPYDMPEPLPKKQEEQAPETEPETEDAPPAYRPKHAKSPEDSEPEP